MINHPNRNKNKAAVASSKTNTKPKKDPTPPADNYDLLASACQRSYNAVAAPMQVPLFRVRAPELWDLYLKSIPKARRQEHDCSACRHFLHHYGPVVTIDEHGRTHTVMFNAQVPDLYKKAFAAMKQHVENGRVIAPFYIAKHVWGQHSTGTWRHMAVTPLPCHVHNARLRSAGQVIAEKVHAFKNVTAGLNEYGSASLDELLRLFRGDYLPRSSQFIGPVEWLRGLHDRPRGVAGHHLLWRAVASAPEGFTHPRSAVWASVLDDIKAGVGFNEMKSKFAAKTHGLIYQRPQAAPKQQNIERAEEVFRTLGLEQSLERRMARLDEVVGNAVWLPHSHAQGRQEGRGGVFGHLKPRQDQTPPKVDLPSKTMTWEKFNREVLAEATGFQVKVPHVGNYLAITTAQNIDAPPILKWDREDERNPFAWYIYHRGSPASQWGLSSNAWVDVTAVVPNPVMWNRAVPHDEYYGMLMALEGCVDSNENSGNALFPECLKSDLHQVRATIEAYSKSATLGGRAGELASGIYLSAKAGPANLIVRAFLNNGWQQYQIDRWD